MKSTHPSISWLNGLAIFLLIAISIITVSWADQQNNRSGKQFYMSFCHDDDVKCIEREHQFLNENGREPATDSELSWVYQVDIDEILTTPDKPQYHTDRLVPPNVKCEDCDTYK